jgi:hypothetical protein
MSLIESLLRLSHEIRYVAIYRDGKLTSRERNGLSNASASESDKYEELIVNPTLLTLVQQRGRIDCGGIHSVLIRYGNFFEYVRPIKGGHASVGIELQADTNALAQNIDQVLEHYDGAVLRSA